MAAQLPARSIPNERGQSLNANRGREYTREPVFLPPLRACVLRMRIFAHSGLRRRVIVRCSPCPLVMGQFGGPIKRRPLTVLLHGYSFIDALRTHRCPMFCWASMELLGIYAAFGSDHTDCEPGPNPSRSIFTRFASRAIRRAFSVIPWSRANSLISRAESGPPANAVSRSSIASAFAV